MKNKIGKVLDVVKDDKGREWPIIKLHEGIAGFRDCPLRCSYDYKCYKPFKKSEAYKSTLDWLNKNMTPKQRKRWGEPFLATLYNIKGDCAHSVAEPYEGEFQFDFYKDQHNQIKIGLDYWENFYSKQYGRFSTVYFSDTPAAGYPEHVCIVFSDGTVDRVIHSDCLSISPCFKLEETK